MHQDAWIFQPPINYDVIFKSNFIMGVSRCDNVIAEILAQNGHIVNNPAFAIHAIEVHNTQREGLGSYTHKNAVLGNGREVLLSDQMIFWYRNRKKCKERGRKKEKKKKKQSEKER